MCHGALDPKYLMREAEGRVQGIVTQADGTQSAGIPPELQSGLRGILARLHLWGRLARG